MKNHLTFADLESLQAGLADLYADVDQSTLADRTLRFAELIIPDAFVSFDYWNAQNALSGILWSNYHVWPSPEQMRLFAQYVHENPVFTEVVVKKRLDPVLLTDFMPIEGFTETTVYREHYRHAGAKYQLAVTLWVSADSMMSCLFWKQEENFGERDRQMLALAAPHFINAVRNASNFDHLTAALEVKNGGVLTLGRDGRILAASDFVRRVWPKYFAGAADAGAELPPELADWMKQAAADGNQPPSFERKNEQGELTARFVTGSRKMGKTLLFEEKRRIAAATLEALGLTRREAEVLFWMAQGKSDREIAEICRISPLTIHKHAQNIYIKLGVETRTAAMLRALEIL